jgi:hypothetical protein
LQGLPQPFLGAAVRGRGVEEGDARSRASCTTAIAAALHRPNPLTQEAVPNPSLRRQDLSVLDASTSICTPRHRWLGRRCSIQSPMITASRSGEESGGYCGSRRTSGAAAGWRRRPRQRRRRPAYAEP